LSAMRGMLGFVGVLRAGVSLGLTGRYAVQSAEVRAGLDLWAADQPVELVVIDDQGSPSRATAAYQALLAEGSRSCWAPMAAGRCGMSPRSCVGRGGCCGTTEARPTTSPRRCSPP
jgi:hypothetical protein